MTNSARLTCVASLLAMALLSCAASGCASMNSASEKWTASWKKDAKPPGNDPNHEEVVSYWGQKKKTPKHVEMSPELKERLAKRAEERQSKTVAESLRDGNQRLKEGRLEESRRAFEQALAVKSDDADAHHGLAVIADKQQLFGVADNHYEAALKKQPRNPNLLNDIGYSHWLRGGDPQAEKMLLEALAVEPGHKGATLNLSTLYGKQGRYEDAYALLSKGATESEAQQYLAKLFPQGRPSGAGSRVGGNREQDFALNQPAPGQRSAPPMPADDRLADSGRMTREQPRADFERRQFENAQQRPSENSQGPFSNDGVAARGARGDALVQDSRPVGDQRPISTPNDRSGPNDRAWANGNGDNSYLGSGGQNGIAAGGPAQSDNAMLPYPGSNSNGYVQQDPQHRYAAAPSQDSLSAPAGTKPHSNIPFWQGAPVVRGNATNNSAPQQPAPNGSSWGQQSPGASQSIEQTNFTDEGTRAGRAAAQLGMSIGGMFPVIPSDSGSTGGSFTPPADRPSDDQRFGGEFNSPPQHQNQSSGLYQNQNGGPWSQGGAAFQEQNSSQGQNSGVQLAPYYSSNPNSSPNRGMIQQTGGNESNADSLSTFAASKRPGGVSTGWTESTQSNSPTGNIPISPESSGNALSRPGDLPSQFGSGDSNSWSQPPAQANTGSGAASPDVSGGRRSRYAKAPWDEPATVPNSQPNNGSRPFSGAWPNSGSQPAGAGSHNGAAPNTIPMWNGGSQAGQPMPNNSGPSSSSPSSGGSPQPWPYSQGR